MVAFTSLVKSNTESTSGSQVLSDITTDFSNLETVLTSKGGSFTSVLKDHTGNEDGTEFRADSVTDFSALETSVSGVGGSFTSAVALHTGNEYPFRDYIDDMEALETALNSIFITNTRVTAGADTRVTSTGDIRVTKEL